jgi:hypothetical protein
VARARALYERALGAVPQMHGETARLVIASNFRGQAKVEFAALSVAASVIRSCLPAGPKSFIGNSCCLFSPAILAPCLDVPGAFMGNLSRQYAVLNRIAKPVHPFFQVVQFLLECLQVMVVLRPGVCEPLLKFFPHGRHPFQGEDLWFLRCHATTA